MGNGEALDAPGGALRPVLWRLHFFTGFVAAPVVVWLCLSGIAFAWNGQLESMIYHRAFTPVADGRHVPLSQQLEVVTSAYPDHEVTTVTPAAAAGETTGILIAPRGARAAGFGPATGALTVYVDPSIPVITGRIHEVKRPSEWLRNMHSNFRLGTGAGTLTELAASLALVSLATGLYLWWPRTVSAVRRSLLPPMRGLRSGARRPWRNLHSAVGVVSVLALALLLVTGLTWTEYAGRWVDAAKRALVPEAPALATALTGTTQEPAGHGDHRTGNGSAVPALRTRDLDLVAAVAAGAGLALPFAVSPPAAPGQAWSVSEIDDRWPITRESIAVDPRSGTVVDRLGFDDNPLLEQATTLGIGFHEGTLFGLANQIGLTILALALLLVVFSGYVMWWRRRPAGAFAAPPAAGRLLRTVPAPLLAGFGLLLVVLPTLGVAFLVYLMAERLIRLRSAA